MPISPIVLQRRQAELGRIRLGQKNPEKGFPMKLDRFRFTSASEQYINDLADLYGGTPQAWDNNGKPEFEVITDAKSIPVIVVKGGLSQFMEFWSGGGCLHRCDGTGELNMITGDPCDLDEKVKVGRKTVNPHAEAKPTTRLSVMLPELEAIGVFRMESHGWNAAAEIPAVAELAQFVGDLVPAVLHLVERRSVKDGETSRYVVPVLDLQIGAAKLREVVAAKSGLAEVEGTSGAPAIEAGRTDYYTLLEDASTPEEVNAIWQQAKDAGHLDQGLADAIAAVAARIKAKTAEPDEDGAYPADVVDDPAEIWQKCVARAGELGMSLWDVETALSSSYDVAVAEATAEQLQAFLVELQGRDAA